MLETQTLECRFYSRGRVCWVRRGEDTKRKRFGELLAFTSTAVSRLLRQSEVIVSSEVVERIDGSARGFLALKSGSKKERRWENEEEEEGSAGSRSKPEDE